MDPVTIHWCSNCRQNLVPSIFSLHKIGVDPSLKHDGSKAELWTEPQDLRAWGFDWKNAERTVAGRHAMVVGDNIGVCMIIFISKSHQITQHAQSQSQIGKEPVHTGLCYIYLRCDGDGERVEMAMGRERER